MEDKGNDLVWAVMIIVLFSLLIALDKSLDEDANLYRKQVESAIEKLNR